MPDHLKLVRTYFEQNQHIGSTEQNKMNCATSNLSPNISMSGDSTMKRKRMQYEISQDAVVSGRKRSNNSDLKIQPNKILKIASNNEKDQISTVLYEPKLHKPILHPQRCPSNMDPDAYIQSITESMMGETPKIVSAFDLDPDYFLVATEEQMASYTTEILFAVQDQDIEALRNLQEMGHSFQCCNRFGESVIHMVCRRGLTRVVEFLLNETNVSIRIKDDYGRTPLHDAFWNKNMNTDIVEMLLKREPELLFITDKRGFTPFSYARMEHWRGWRQFLYEKRELLSVDKKSSVLKIVGQQ